MAIKKSAGSDSLMIMIAIFIINVFNATAQPGKGWTTEFTGVGTHSSPRAVDLNGDGIKDLVIGCGKKEFQQIDTGIIAVNGKNGKIMWTVEARDQIYGSAAICDLNKDGTPDVVIGGRSAELKAINGKNGKVIWAFFPKGNAMEPRKKGWYNFYNPQPIPDQNNDGIEDILVSNGGDILVPAFNPNRPAGTLLVIDGSNGKILAQAKVPDGKETYLSLVISKFSKDDTDYTIIFGTGGETIGGNLYRTTLKDLMKGDISGAISLYNSKEKGFIAPPALCDVNLDGCLDIIDNAVEGTTLAIDGRTNKMLWKKNIANTEVYGSMAVGYFNNDSIPDIFTTFTKGVWPNLNESKQVMYNGKNGEIEFLDSLGILQTSSPVVADFNGDGVDDGLVNINFKVVEKEFFHVYHNMLAVYDFQKQSTYPISLELAGINLSSTPWLGDLDGDGKLDIVYCYLTNTRSETAMDGFKMIRLNTGIEIKKAVKWGSYMGSSYNGVFKP